MRGGDEEKRVAPFSVSNHDSWRADVGAATLRLRDYCRQSGWAGYDPYDALNSTLFEAVPLLDFRLFRLALTQALKRSPLNVRPLLGVAKRQNPKGLGLFLSACIDLARQGAIDDDTAIIAELTDAIASLRAPSRRYWCWGYSFPWQTRTMLVPRGAANLVCTTFVANGLLDAYERTSQSRHLDMAVSAADYVVDELYWTDPVGGFAGFRYPLPTSSARVHNASFLGAALLCRVARHAGERRYLAPALAAARYAAGQQLSDGSWDYGEHATQRWKDNFHTGFNLCALRAIGRYAATSEFERCVERGFAFYRNHFFTDEGAPRYFHDRTYPIDAHSVAQSIITLAVCRDLHPQSLEMAVATFRWAMANMWDRRGYFYYRKLRFGTNRISYMRWSQAWMLLALATLQREIDDGGARDGD